MKSLCRLLTLLTLCCAIAACDSEGRTRGPSTNALAVHAAPSFGQLSFLREERASADLPYRGAASFSFETGPYDFNVETLPPGASTPTRQGTFAATLEPDTDYQFIITETPPGTLDTLILSKPTFDTAATNAEVTFVHAAPAYPAADVYLTAPGADLSAENPVGSTSFRQQVAPQTFAPGDYELSLTEPANPLNVLFRSAAGSLVAGQTNLFVITDGAGEGTVAANVVRVAGDTTVLTDVNSTAGIRAINAADDGLARDIVANDNFAAPLFAALPYADVSPYVPFAPGSADIVVTPAGNPGVIEGEVTSTILRGRAYTTVVAGAPGDLEVTTTIEDRRRVADRAQLRLFNGAGQFSSLDFFVLPPGSEIGSFSPIALAPAGTTALQGVPPGDIELTVRITGTTTIALGPLALSVVGGGLYGIAVVNGATADTVEAVLIDDFE
jgi:hypothetical protein